MENFSCFCHDTCVLYLISLFLCRQSVLGRRNPLIFHRPLLSTIITSSLNLPMTHFPLYSFSNSPERLNFLKRGLIQQSFTCSLACKVPFCVLLLALVATNSLESANQFPRVFSRWSLFFIAEAPSVLCLSHWKERRVCVTTPKPTCWLVEPLSPRFFVRPL